MWGRHAAAGASLSLSQVINNNNNNGDGTRRCGRAPPGRQRSGSGSHPRGSHLRGLPQHHDGYYYFKQTSCAGSAGCGPPRLPQTRAGGRGPRGSPPRTATRRGRGAPALSAAGPVRRDLGSGPAERADPNLPGAASSPGTRRRRGQHASALHSGLFTSNSRDTAHPEPRRPGVPCAPCVPRAPGACVRAPDAARAASRGREDGPRSRDICGLGRGTRAAGLGPWRSKGAAGRGP